MAQGNTLCHDLPKGNKEGVALDILLQIFNWCFNIFTKCYYIGYLVYFFIFSYFGFWHCSKMYFTLEKLYIGQFVVFVSMSISLLSIKVLFRIELVFTLECTVWFIIF